MGTSLVHLGATLPWMALLTGAHSRCAGWYARYGICDEIQAERAGVPV